MYRIIISPKDSSAKIEQEVELYWQEGNCLCIRYKGGCIRMYPMVHIWYFEIVNKKRK